MNQPIFQRLHGTTAAFVTVLALLLVSPADAQETDFDSAPAAPSEYLDEAIEGENEVGGTDAQQVDSQEVQADEALDGEDVPGVSRFRQQQLSLIHISEPTRPY